MAIQMDFSFTAGQDGVIHVSLQPPMPIGGLDIEFTLCKRQGGTPLITGLCGSGFGAGQSGITVTNSGVGQFDVAMPGRLTSGWEPGNYYHRTRVTTSGRNTPLVDGYDMMEG